MAKNRKITKANSKSVKGLKKALPTDKLYSSVSAFPIVGIDLVLMDIIMPEMDGYDATRKIRKQKRFAELPIIAVTAKAMKDDLKNCLEAGANDYVSKPVDLETLLSLIRVKMPQLEMH